MAIFEAGVGEFVPGKDWEMSSPDGRAEGVEPEGEEHAGELRDDIEPILPDERAERNGVGEARKGEVPLFDGHVQ